MLSCSENDWDRSGATSRSSCLSWASFPIFHSIYVLPEQTCLSKEDNLSHREQVWWCVLELQGFTGSLAGVHRREAGLSEMTLKTKELF